MREHGRNAVGQTFGYYLVLEVETRTNNKNAKRSWAKCRCQCGKIKWVGLAALKQGTTKSCGCFNKYLRSLLVGDKASSYRHGHYLNKKQSLTRSSWSSMMTRCYYKKSNRYHVYGANGIKVWEKWHDFTEFLKDMGERPSKNHTLDRIDNSRGYEPGNVRWATKSEQAINRRTTKFYTISGENKCLKHWAKIYGIDYVRVYRRIFQLKWDVMKALETPVR